ncbi:MAG: LysR family transcriptional regulator [Polyangiaceae bacterium]
MTTRTRKSRSSFDDVTLDQLRVLLSVADEGGFSAAARRLGRVQSAVSQSMASLEALVGFKVWDRSERAVKLTERGRPLVPAARRVLAEAAKMGEISDALHSAKSERLSIAVDAIFPPRALVTLISALKQAFPSLALRVDTDTLASISTRVARHEFDIGIAGPLGISDALERIAVGSVLLVPVAARSHPLAQIKGRIASDVIANETQIVLSERGVAGGSPDQGVVSQQTWRVADLVTKRELLLGGLGWGNLPEPLIRDDLKRGDLVRLNLAAWTDEEHRLPLALVFSPAIRARPLVRWLITNVPPLCSEWGVGLS